MPARSLTQWNPSSYIPKCSLYSFNIFFFLHFKTIHHVRTLFNFTFQQLIASSLYIILLNKTLGKNCCAKGKTITLVQVLIFAPSYTWFQAISTFTDPIFGWLICSKGLILFFFFLPHWVCPHQSVELFFQWKSIKANFNETMENISLHLNITLTEMWRNGFRIYC